MRQPSLLSKRYWFPGEIISHAVWLDDRVLLRYRDVEELLAERGMVVSQETIRQWCRTVGPAVAEWLRRRRPRPGDTWPLDRGTHCAWSVWRSCSFHGSRWASRALRPASP